MHRVEAQRWQHAHDYAVDRTGRGERATRQVIALTGSMMVVEIAAGHAFHSMALLADGWHMASHASALGITAFAYRYARRHRGDARYSFGTWKVGVLGGYTSAVVLAVIAVLIAWTSAQRLLEPLPIRFDEAIGVAALGLAVNLVSAWLLRGQPHAHGHGHGAHGDHGGHAHGPEAAHVADPDHARGHAQEHEHVHGHTHAHDDAHVADHVHAHDDGHAHGNEPTGARGHRSRIALSVAGAHGHDHNLRGAYLHVLADALTSVLAIVALLAGRIWGWAWMDPAMGLVGAAVIARWAYGLVRDTAAVLLDGAVPAEVLDRIRQRIESEPDQALADLHVWQVGPEDLAAIVSVVTHDPRPAEHYRRLAAEVRPLAHVTVEVHPCAADGCDGATGAHERAV